MKTCTANACSNPVFGKGFCKFHQWMRADKSSKELKVRAPIRPISKKKAKELRTYLKRDPSWKLENPYCAVPGCGRPTSDRHHVIGQGIHMNDKRYHIPLCREHHVWCKERPEWAKSLKLIETRTISRKRIFDEQITTC